MQLWPMVFKNFPIPSFLINTGFKNAFNWFLLFIQIIPKQSILYIRVYEYIYFINYMVVTFSFGVVV